MSVDIDSFDEPFGATAAVSTPPPVVRGSPMRMLRILDLVGAAYDVGQADILGPRRFRSVSLARQCCMWLARRATEMSYPQIGAVFGRDHTTVMAGCIAHAKRMQRDPGERLRTERILFDVLKGDVARCSGTGLEFHELELAPDGQFDLAAGAAE